MVAPQPRAIPQSVVQPGHFRTSGSAINTAGKRLGRPPLALGYAGVYSSFLLFAKRAEQKYGIQARELLVELGRRGTVGGQEDMIEDLALTLSRQRGVLPT
ncbi:hypothetical protein R0G64_20585 [Pseudomonas otitidis]|uniref:DmpG-like communication domain-containing protein n=1 Tax=Metapseudomonas otitidis TaxID=319939 RepID=A0ABU3XV79_9GAMM|nr:hypothetical protein [Pseudomonas otitidis]MDV3441817.1 hypothetical protein [Pseudomonas otitidis]WMR34711.1 hypothetical protein QT513_08215 [Pseudomonas otitidis]